MIVLGHLVVARTEKGMRHLSKGDVVPDDVTAESLAHLQSLGYVSSDGPSKADGIPPKAGRGSSVEAWQEYAIAKDVEVDPDAKRDDVIAALEAAGVPTE